MSRWTPTLVTLVTLASQATAWADDDKPESEPAGRPVPVEGLVTYDGPVPDPIPVAEEATVRHPVEVDPRTRGLKEAVVWLEGVPAEAANRARNEPAVMDQKNFFFVPHVLDVEAGRAVEFRSDDWANHGVAAASPEAKNRFNVAVPPGGKYTHRFVASGSPVALSCPIHTAMSGWVYVFDHPYFAVTDDRGRFRLPPVPPGRYTVHVRHPDGGMRRDQEVIVRGGKRLDLRVGFHGGDRKGLGGSGSTSRPGKPDPDGVDPR